MICTVTLNPSLDRTLHLPALRPGTIHRARLVRTDLGGKGVNVSRALRALGIPSRIVAFAGGWTGRVLRDGLRAEGYRLAFVEVDGGIRQNITLFDEAGGEYTKINEQGQAVNSGQIARLEKLISRLACRGDLWTFSGSLPPGAPADLYARLVGLVQARGGRAFLDTSGEALREGQAARPYALKVNTEEAGALLGREVQDENETAAAAMQLLEKGPRLVMLTRGARGAILATDGQLVNAIPPAIPAASPVGAGDAALAGLLWAVQEGCDPTAIARRAVACGTATAMQTGTGMGDRALIEELLGKVNILPFPVGSGEKRE